jgi:hypothetical protein
MAGQRLICSYGENPTGAVCPDFKMKQSAYLEAKALCIGRLDVRMYIILVVVMLSNQVNNIFNQLIANKQEENRT